NQRAYIVLDYDDALSVSTRAGLPLGEFLHEAHHHGATHLALPELTLHRLLAKGRLATTVPASAVAGWTYLACSEQALAEHLARELAARLTSTSAPVWAGGDTPTVAFQGDLPTLAELGLGFEAGIAATAAQSGLGVVPRPVSFAWPEDRLVQRTLAQAAG